MPPGSTLRCPRCSRSISKAKPGGAPERCEHCGASIGDSPTAEKLFYPPGFRRSEQKSQPESTSETYASADRYPPGFLGKRTSASAPPTFDSPPRTVDELMPPAVELPPGIEAPPGIELSPAYAPAADVDGLLPEAVDGSPGASPAAPDVVAKLPGNAPTIGGSAIDATRQSVERKDHRRFIGNLIVWAACTLLLCLTLWFLLVARK